MQEADRRDEEVRLDKMEIEVDLLEVFYRLAENIKYIALVAIIGMLLAVAYNHLIAKPVYSATSKLYVMSSGDSAINLSDLQIGAYLTRDYQEVFAAWEVQEMVLQNLGLDYTYSRLSDMIQITNPDNTRMLYITARAGSAEEAAALANEFASVAMRYIADTMETEEPNLFSSALVPQKPISPRKLRNALLGFFAGALLMSAIIVVRFLLDDKIKNADDIRRYGGMVTLAVVPRNDGTHSRSRGQGLFLKRSR